MNIACRNLVGTIATLMLAATAATAMAAPTQQDVSKARADCRAHKQRVMKLETRAAKSDPALQQARLDWEMSCHKAEMLISEKTGEAPPQPEPAAAAAPPGR